MENCDGAWDLLGADILSVYYNDNPKHSVRFV
jgi:hypothetical protein